MANEFNQESKSCYRNQSSRMEILVSKSGYSGCAEV